MTRADAVIFDLHGTPCHCGPDRKREKRMPQRNADTQRCRSEKIISNQKP